MVSSNQEAAVVSLKVLCETHYATDHVTVTRAQGEWVWSLITINITTTHRYISNQISEPTEQSKQIR